MKCRAWLMVLFLALLPTAYSAESGYTYRATEVRARPFLDAPVVITLPELSRVEILNRQGAWMQIKTRSAQQGWVRMLSVRLGNPDQKPKGGNLLSSIGIASRPRPATTATVTTGVRGFSAEDLAKAEPNPAEAEKMKGFAAKPAEAKAFAESGKLAPRTVAYFDADGKPLKDKK
jgi:hypothetical protein